MPVDGTPDAARPPSTPSRVGTLFDRPFARPGTWRTVGSVRVRGAPEVVVLASERGAGSSLRKVGVIPFLPAPLLAETLALVTRRGSHSTVGVPLWVSAVPQLDFSAFSG